MKVAIITDQHFGARKNSKLFHDHFLKFYNEIFFPTIEKEGITTIIDMGDTFDSRKGIDFSSLSWAKNYYYDRLKEIGCDVVTVVGNHTAYYKNTNQINAVDLLLREYENVHVISEPVELNIHGLNILFIPWINPENEEKSIKMISNTQCKVAMGHLELQGFRANSNIIMEHGQDSKIFDSFTKVFSGHYHTRSTNGTVFYLGNPYEIYWTDVNDPRGFAIFDTETLDHYHIDNPYTIFEIYYYDEEEIDDLKNLNLSRYENKIIKIIIKKKTNQLKFEKFLDNLYASNASEIKIVENFNVDHDSFIEDLESEDTLTTLNRYIKDLEIDMDKSKINSIIQNLYKESCAMI